MKIIIPGKPIPQTRMRHCGIRTYDPRAKEKKQIREFLKTQQNVLSYKYPRISFLFHMPIPKTLPKRDVNTYNSGIVKHVKKVDIDNLVKLYLDCLTGIIIDKDETVALGSCVKVYHPEPKSIIWIHETQQIMTDMDFDIQSLDALES